MTGSPAFLGIDLGAESGRLILGTLHPERLALSEIHRFLIRPVRLPDALQMVDSSYENANLLCGDSFWGNYHCGAHRAPTW